MSDKSRINKSNPGILGYDPKNARPTPKQLQCQYCWYSTHAKNQMTKHINENHWDEAKA